MTPPNPPTSKHRARKRFGQNFLQDKSVIDRILHAVSINDNDHLVEIGPGLGALSYPIAASLSSANRFDLIELDRDLAAKLAQHFEQPPTGQPTVFLHETDALTFDFSALHMTTQQPLRIIGNLPYNISTPLLFHLFDHINNGAHGEPRQPVIKDMFFMLQKEVVDRMTAPPGNKTYGRLSVMSQYICEVQHLFDVPAEAFSPKPKVQSAIVRLQPHSSTQALPVTPKQLNDVVKLAFSQRRKTLINNVKTRISTTRLQQLGIDPGARAETLSLDQFIAITQALESETP